MKRRLELVTTGSELLNGSVLNGHARWLGAQLFDVNWSLERDTTVSDEFTAIYEAIQSAMSRVDVVIVTGGLGPTSDDRTRDAAAKWLGSDVVVHEPTLEKVRSVYRRLNKAINNTVERHALVVDGAGVLENNHGMAPGEHLEKDGKHLFLLPGPPSEFQGVMSDHVMPLLASLSQEGDIQHHIFQTAGIGESNIASILEEKGVESSHFDISYCASPGSVTVRIRQGSGNPDEFEAAVLTIRESLADVIYAEADEQIEQTLAKLLTQEKVSLSVAESCTGGMIGARITAIPGSSVFMRGGVIAYHNEVKEKVLCVDADVLKAHGAVSSQVAEAMAEGVRDVTGSDIGLSVTGIAGPGGGTDEKPVGLVYIGVADEAGTISSKFNLGGNRNTVRNAASVVAMDLVRKRLLRLGE